MPKPHDARSATRRAPVALLDTLAVRSGLGVNELARRIGVNASTASRLLATLQESGLVSRDAGSGPYRLGLRLVTLADRALAEQDVACWRAHC